MSFCRASRAIQKVPKAHGLGTRDVKSPCVHSNRKSDFASKKFNYCYVEATKVITGSNDVKTTN